MSDGPLPIGFRIVASMLTAVSLFSIIIFFENTGMHFSAMSALGGMIGFPAMSYAPLIYLFFIPMYIGHRLAWYATQTNSDDDLRNGVQYLCLLIVGVAIFINVLFDG
jgi:hypothetical protein